MVNPRSVTLTCGKTIRERSLPFRIVKFLDGRGLITTMAVLEIYRYERRLYFIQVPLRSLGDIEKRRREA